MTTRAQRQSGFTLIELMLVVALIGILAGVAYTSFRTQTMKSRRAEAMVGLSGIFRAQRAYFTEHQVYGDTFDEIGFQLEGGRRIDAQTLQGHTYTFTVRALPGDGKDRGNFQAMATGDLDPGDGVMDVLMIENDVTVGP